MENDSRNKMRYILYTLAGLYLLYTSYGLFRGLSGVEGTEKMIMLVSMIFFGIFGAGLVVIGVKKSTQISRGEAGKEEDEIAEETGEIVDKREEEKRDSGTDNE